MTPGPATRRGRVRVQLLLMPGHLPDGRSSTEIVLLVQAGVQLGGRLSARVQPTTGAGHGPVPRKAPNR